jgi:hypothetical protein
MKNIDKSKQNPYSGGIKNNGMPRLRGQFWPERGVNYNLMRAFLRLGIEWPGSVRFWGVPLYVDTISMPGLFYFMPGKTSKTTEDLNMATFTIKEKATGAKVGDAFDIYKRLERLKDADQTSLWVMGFNADNVEIERECVMQAGLNDLFADMKLIFRRVLSCGAVSFVIVHNHPAGFIKPSAEDMQFALSLKNISTVLDLNFLDFIIIGDEGYLSFCDRGLLKPGALEAQIRQIKDTAETGRHVVNHENVININEFRRNLQ